MPIQSQSAQYDVFGGERWARDRQARVEEYEVADLLHGPSIHAGLNDTRRAAYDAVPGFQDRSVPSQSDLYAHEPHHMSGDEYERENLHDPQQYIPEHLVQGRPSAQSLALGGGYDDYDPHSAENLEGIDPSFRSARIGGPVRTAVGVPPAQTPPGEDPVWLGHTFAPGHRVGLPWKGTLIPGTVTHLEGNKVGVSYDDGQHAAEEPSDIRPLY